MDREQAMKPGVLVVDDDAVTLAFFGQVLAALPIRVESAVSCAEALTRADTGRHALWLVDAHLPDGDAAMLLPRLRMRAPDAIAFAHTASREPVLHRQLHEAGFARVLVKPLAVGELLAAVGASLRLPVRESRDDAARVLAMRELLAGELPGAVAEVDAAALAGDAAAMRAVLHRLKSSCAFARSDALGIAVAALDAAPLDRTVLEGFRSAARRAVPRT